MLYFAYGSNMFLDQIRQRCPSVRHDGAAILDGYRLAFTRTSTSNWPGYGVADVVPAEGRQVFGALFLISGDEISMLDRWEGYRPGRQRNNYARVEVSVRRLTEPHDVVAAQTYVVCDKQAPNPLPHRDYVARIIAGAKSINAPQEYLDELAQIAVRD